jgi:hypothetical protein
LKCNLKTIRAYLFKEDFQAFWNYVSPVWAAKFLDQWRAQVMRSRLEPMKKVAKTPCSQAAHLELVRRKKRHFSGSSASKQETADLKSQMGHFLGVRRDRIYRTRITHCFEPKGFRHRCSHRFRAFCETAAQNATEVQMLCDISRKKSRVLR